MDTHKAICFSISIRKRNELPFAGYLVVWICLVMRLPVQKQSKLPSKRFFHQNKLTGKQLAVSVTMCSGVESFISIRKEEIILTCL
jgi:hypothetical protein